MAKNPQKQLYRLLLSQPISGGAPMSVEKGYWQWTAMGVVVGCPKCGTCTIIDGDLTISENGDVHPMVVCNSLQCDWMETVKLDKYDDPVY